MSDDIHIYATQSASKLETLADAIMHLKEAEVENIIERIRKLLALANPTTPFNIALHEHLVGLGFEWTRHDEDAGDEGDGESGPMPWYHPAYDAYAGGDDGLCFYASADGTIHHQFEQPDPPGYDA